MTDKLIMTRIIYEMKDAQQSMINGDNKKDYVMKKLKEYMDKETYERYEPMISLTIDFIKHISKNKEILKGLHNVMFFMHSKIIKFSLPKQTY